MLALCVANQVENFTNARCIDVALMVAQIVGSIMSNINANALQIGTVRSVGMWGGHWANLLLCDVFIHEFNLEI